jgi:hypothetical protein
MFEFLDILEFGRKVTIQDEEWLILRPLQNGCSLAVKPTDKMPCPVWLIQEPSARQIIEDIAEKAKD